jgi:hypothetical protein
MLRCGKHAVRKLKQGQALLAADAGVADGEIVCAVSLSARRLGGGS